MNRLCQTLKSGDYLKIRDDLCVLILQIDGGEISNCTQTKVLAHILSPSCGGKGRWKQAGCVCFSVNGETAPG